MKTYYFLSALLCLCACTGNKTNKDTTLAESETVELQETVINHLDSLATILCDSTQLASIHSVFAGDAVKLTDEQKMLKPDFLLENKDFEGLATLSEKYRANAIAIVDSRVVALYGLHHSSDYIACVERLQADIADLAFEQLKAKGHKDLFDPETYTQLYNEMKNAKRLPYFYETTTAMVVETLYVLSQNGEALVSQLTDEQTRALVHHLSVVTDAINHLSQTNTYLKKSAKQLSKLASINASTTSELKDQLATAKKEIGVLRMMMLKDSED